MFHFLQRGLAHNSITSRGKVSPVDWGINKYFIRTNKSQYATGTHANKQLANDSYMLPVIKC